MKISRSTVISALHYAVRIFIGAVIVELVMHYIGINPIWAIVSLIVVTEPQIKTAWGTFTARFINTILGCIIGIAFLMAFGLNSGLLAVAVLVAATLSIIITNMQQGWRIGPVTVALVMSAGISEKSVPDALTTALERTGAVLGGSIVALIVTWCISHIWMPPEAKSQENLQ